MIYKIKVLGVLMEKKRIRFCKKLRPTIRINHQSRKEHKYICPDLSDLIGAGVSDLKTQNTPFLQQESTNIILNIQLHLTKMMLIDTERTIQI
ncbi:hypothetical protein CHH79_17915 [Bacillus siamensis]|nr:hypothetical protein CHH79_17915 [Bacillus siamensis]